VERVAKWGLIILLITIGGVLANIQIIELGAKQGYPEAENELGRRFDLGCWFYKQDKEQAKLWYLNSAQKNYAQAQFNLGLTLAKERAYEQAASWYLRAALNDFAPAQYNLALLYLNGLGVTKNPKEAIKWLTTAALAGRHDAQYLLGLAYARGDGVPYDPVLAAQFVKKSAEGGYGTAQGYLSTLYLNGKGVPVNVVTAREWAVKAISNGNELSKQTLKLIDEFNK
jgi:TPR repeat protein